VTVWYWWKWCVQFCDLNLSCWPAGWPLYGHRWPLVRLGIVGQHSWPAPTTGPDESDL